MVLGVFGNFVWVLFPFLQLLCSLSPPTDGATPPPLWAGRRPTPVSPPPHASPLDPWTHIPRALYLFSPCHAPPRLRRLPPRRRRGQHGIEPCRSFFRAPQHPEDPRILILALVPQLPASTPQNTTTATRTPASSKLTVDPPFQTRSARADATISSASSSRSSQTSPPRPEPTGATSPPTTYT